MRKGRALREPGRTRRVLDVDRLVEVELRLSSLQGLARNTVTGGEQLVPVLAEDDPPSQRRRVHLAEQPDVVGVLEAPRRDQHRAARLPQRVLELVRPVGRIDVDEDRADLGGRELDDHPLRVVRRPDADPVAARHAGRHHPARAPIDLGVQLVVRPADALVARDERIRGAVGRDRLVPHPPDRLRAERRLPRARRVSRPRRHATRAEVSLSHRGIAMGARIHRASSTVVFAVSRYIESRWR